MPKKRYSRTSELETNDFSTIYADVITFIMSLFILLFVISSHSEDFIKEVQLRFGAKKIEQERAITTDSILVSRIQGFLEDEKLEDQASILVDEYKIKLILHPPVLFESGKATLLPGGQTIVQDLVNAVGVVDNPIIIEGHTDNLPIHNAQFDSNWDLSFARAYAVMKFLMSKFSFSPLQLSGQGFGEYRPIATNDTPEGRNANRRIEFNIIRIKQSHNTKGT